MEHKIKYQYSYFIYPFVIEEQKYDRYLLKLVKNKNCRLRFFQKEKELNIYTHFLPKIREYLFWSFGLTKQKIKKFETLDKTVQAGILAKNPCNIFQYDIRDNIQGKIGQEGTGIFFDIRKIEIICFETGICFMVFKTTLEGDSHLSDVLNFNYDFRDIQSSFYGWKPYENIKIQTGAFKDVEEFSSLIQEIAGDNAGAKEIGIDKERFLTYSYACLDHNSWHTENAQHLQKELYQFANVLPADIQTDYTQKEENPRQIRQKETQYGFSEIATVLATSDDNTENYTKLPFAFENEYLYTYLFELYKMYYLRKLDLDFKKKQNFKENKNKFIKFTQNLKIQNVTNDAIANQLIDKWRDLLKVEEVFTKITHKYSILYKEYNIERTAKTNIAIVVLLLSLLIVNFVRLMLL